MDWGKEGVVGKRVRRRCQFEGEVRPVVRVVCCDAGVAARGGDQAPGGEALVVEKVKDARQVSLGRRGVGRAIAAEALGCRPGRAAEEAQGVWWADADYHWEVAAGSGGGGGEGREKGCSVGGVDGGYREGVTRPEDDAATDTENRQDFRVRGGVVGESKGSEGERNCCRGAGGGEGDVGVFAMGRGGHGSRRDRGRGIGG